MLKNKYYPALTTIFAVAAFGMATGANVQAKADAGDKAIMVMSPATSLKSSALLKPLRRAGLTNSRTHAVFAIITGAIPLKSCCKY